MKDTFNLSDTKNRTPETWQEEAYERLKVLYGVGKILASNESIQETFPSILNLVGEKFSFMTAVLIENKGDKVGTEIWVAKNTAKEAADLVLEKAKKSFDYLTGNKITTMKLEATSGSHFISLPLIVDKLPPFGVVQLEFRRKLSEEDLEFADALSALIAVAVDRHYKTRLERQQKEREAQKTAIKLSESQNLVAELETEKDLRESFVSLLSHDLRTPLSAAKISAQLILREADATVTSQTFAGRIVDSIDRAIRMIGDLLDANRIRSGQKLPLRPEKISLYNFVQSCLEEISSVQGDRFELNGSKDIEVIWDSAALRRIIDNLTNNAIKYGEEDRPVTLTIKNLEHDVSISVHNDGEGIPAAEQKTLFEQFRRAKKAEGSTKQGWGLGLTLVRGVAEAHGGKVAVESAKGKGTTFIVTMPKDARSYIEKGLKL